MSTNEWITDRLPTKEDVLLGYYIWVSEDSYGCNNSVYAEYYTSVRLGRPWQRIVRPEPYVKAEPCEPNLLEAAERVVKRWDSPLWKDQPHTAVFIDQLRIAITNAKGEQP